MKRTLSRYDESVDRRVRVLKALANPTRLNLVRFLSRGPATVSTLAESLDLKPCIASQQLGILRSSNIVRGLRDGGHVRYELIDTRVLGMISDMGANKIQKVKSAADSTEER